MGFVQNDFTCRQMSQNSPNSHVWTSSLGGMILSKLEKTQTANLHLDFHAYGIISRNSNIWVLSRIWKIEEYVGIVSKLDLVWEIWVSP
jgi:hypothetical protein